MRPQEPMLGRIKEKSTPRLVPRKIPVYAVVLYPSPSVELSNNRRSVSQKKAI